MTRPAHRIAALGLAAAALLACPRRVAAPTPVTTSPDAIYFVLVDRFANGDPSNDGEIDLADPAAFHGGDLQGLIDHLDELHALGIRTVWLSPVFQMRTEKFFQHGAFHGYWTYDLNRVEPRFGSEALLRKLSDELHRRGMRLLLDLVVNHVGPDAPLVKERPDWFHRRGPLRDWNDPEQLTGHDVHGLPDLAQEREDVYRFLMDSTLRWVREVRPDGFRLDAVKHVPLPFWARFNGELHAAGPGLFLLGEMLDGDAAVLAKTGREGNFDAMFDFPLGFALVDVFCKDQPPSRLGVALSQDRLYADPDSLVTLLDNHDLPRVMTQCGGEAERVRQALVVLLTARGTPSLLYGTEAGLAGATEPENRGDMRFGVASELRETIASTLALRREHPALSQGVSMVLLAEEGLFAYARVAPSEVAVIAVNRRGEAAELKLPPELAVAATFGDARLAVEPRSVRVFLGAPVLPNGLAGLHRRGLELRSGALRRTVVFDVGPSAAGEELLVVGSSPEVGAWNPERGALVRDGSAARVELPLGTVLEFKLVARTKGGKPLWEEGGNRVLFVEDGDGPLHVRAARIPGSN